MNWCYIIHSAWRKWSTNSCNSSCIRWRIWGSEPEVQAEPVYETQPEPEVPDEPIPTVAGPEPEPEPDAVAEAEVEQEYLSIEEAKHSGKDKNG